MVNDRGLHTAVKYQQTFCFDILDVCLKAYVSPGLLVPYKAISCWGKMITLKMMTGTKMNSE